MSLVAQIQTASKTTAHLNRFFGVATDRRTYLGIVYLLLAFVLGQLYFMLYLVAVGFGIVLSFLVIGIPILFGALVGARYLGQFERVLANALLDTDIRQPAPIQHDDLWTTAVAYTTDTATWRSLGFVMVKFWLGLLSGLLLLVGFVLVLALIGAPVGDAEVFGWQIDSTAERLLAVPVGVVGFFVLLHVCNVVATLSGRAATALLDAERTDSSGA